MRAFFGLLVVGMAAGLNGLVFADTPKDDASFAEQMKKCEVCKVLADKPELMEHMTWETHKIENGMLCVASVPKDQKKDFEAAHKQMMQSIAKVTADQKAGKKVQLCAMCAGMGDLMKAGAKQQQINTATGAISLVTSSDPAVVEKIHAQADKAIAEHKKMEQHNQVSAVR